MQQQPVSTNPGRLIFLIKSAYWVALLIIAAMAMASYILLQQMIGAQQRDHALLSLIGTQKALSQRVIFLANAANAAPRSQKPQLVAALKIATAEFERSYDVLLGTTHANALSPERHNPETVESVLFAKPYHLNFFALGLAENGWRFISALETDLDINSDPSGYLAGKERAQLDETVAKATLEGFTALGERLKLATDRRVGGLVSMHRQLFYATIGVIVFVALFIFRPMSNAILRRTHELVDARNSMAYIATHDGLTGLHNRTFLTDHFDTLLKGAQRRGERLAVVQFDLDRFKQINDTLGHAAGDLVLVMTAQRMREACRASDLCVRLGGDEFVIILQGAGTTGDIDMVADRIMSRINAPIAFQGTTIQPGASAGIAVYPVDADDARNLLVHADLALYAAKRQGGGGHSFFSEELRRDLNHRQRLEQDMRGAIANNAFDVHFQPQVSMSTGAVAGVEALVRWKHPERGMVSPSEFIPIAEKYGLMVDIGRIIVAKAIAEAAEWHRAGIPFGRLAVNVSGTELREPGFDTFLFATLAKSGLPTEKFALEIVESVILDDEKTGVAAKLRLIRSAGVHLELDDFGTGYASLSHVNPKEIDRLKIDRRFVQNIDANSDSAKIVRALTELARGLGISIIAEGAETEAELAALQSLGCDQVQGYSIALPMPASEARSWLHHRHMRKPQLSVVKGNRV